MPFGSFLVSENRKNCLDFSHCFTLIGLVNSNIWKKATAKEVLSLFSNVVESEKSFFLWLKLLEEGPELFDTIHGHLWNHRISKEAKAILNHPALPPIQLLKFIYLGFGKRIADGDHSNFYDQIPELLTPQTCLRVLFLNEEMQRDSSLRIHLLAALDPPNWKKYFEFLGGANFSLGTISTVFDGLDEDQIKLLLFQNPNLSAYLGSHILWGDKAPKDVSSHLEERIATFLELIQTWQNFHNGLRIKFEKEEEQHASSLSKDRRLSYILNKILQSPKKDRFHVLLYLLATGAIQDESEYLMLKETVENFQYQGQF